MYKVKLEEMYINSFCWFSLCKSFKIKALFLDLCTFLLFFFYFILALAM